MRGNGEDMNSQANEKIVVVFRDFMTGIAKLDELSHAGSKFLTCFQQALEFLRRPPLDMKSDFVNEIVAANQTKWFKSYIDAGCINTDDGIENISKLRSAKLGLGDHLKKAKETLNGLEGLLEDANNVIQNACRHNSLSNNVDGHDESDGLWTFNDKDDTVLDYCQNHDSSHFGALLGIIYSMFKQDHLMQERIISALSLKSSAGELESYCLMWLLRPYINDEILHQAWRQIS